MLERDTFMVRRIPGWRGVTLEVRDAAGELLGRVGEVVGRGTALLRLILGRRTLPSCLVLRETLDDSLLATVEHLGNLVRTRVDVNDAQGDIVGSFVPSAVGPFALRDREELRIAWVDTPALPSRFLDVTQDHELGRAGQEGDFLIIRLSPKLADRPLTKLLLLATSLWLYEK